MSSIYKKGRDGYFYYQTYVFNPKSKKRDKKVFHALGTKDLHGAKKKQVELDKKYESSSNTELPADKRKYLLSIKSTIAISLFSVIITILVGKYLNPKVGFKEIESAIITEDNGLDRKTNNANDLSKINTFIEEKIVLVNEDNLMVEKKIIKQEEESTIKNYNIERVDTLSSAFNQGKIYVTINENTANNSQRLLCGHLAKRFSDFSNIIICLYADNDIGKKLATGNEQLVSVKEQKRYWLAMYTFNSVEGEYFDDDPGSYLGN